MEQVELKNKKQNEGICECGHHSKDHSYNPDTDNDNLECNKCDCKNYKFKEFA